MTNAIESEQLTRIGPGSMMGDLMRQYWLPAVKSSELAAGGDPLRLMLLGEKLIAFRDSNGRVGVMDHRCPHRCASLFYGRNEDGGIRCVYHGWKFDADGNCLDMPNLHAGAGFPRQGARQGLPGGRARRGDLGLHGRTRGGAADAGDRGDAAATESDLAITFTQRECNWLQALEGDIDTSHFSLAACRLGAARAGRSGQLADVPGGQPRARLPRDRHRLGHDVLRVPAGRGGKNLLAVRAFRLPVLDLHSAG